MIMWGEPQLKSLLNQLSQSVTRTSLVTITVATEINWANTERQIYQWVSLIHTHTHTHTHAVRYACLSMHPWPHMYRHTHTHTNAVRYACLSMHAWSHMYRHTEFIYSLSECLCWLAGPINLEIWKTYTPPNRLLQIKAEPDDSSVY